MLRWQSVRAGLGKLDSDHYQWKFRNQWKYRIPLSSTKKKAIDKFREIEAQLKRELYIPVWMARIKSQNENL